MHLASVKARWHSISRQAAVEILLAIKNKLNAASYCISNTLQGESSKNRQQCRGKEQISGWRAPRRNMRDDAQKPHAKRLEVYQLSFQEWMTAIPLHLHTRHLNFDNSNKFLPWIFVSTMTLRVNWPIRYSTTKANCPLLSNCNSRLTP